MVKSVARPCINLSPTPQGVANAPEILLYDYSNSRLLGLHRDIRRHCGFSSDSNTQSCGGTWGNDYPNPNPIFAVKGWLWGPKSVEHPVKVLSHTFESYCGFVEYWEIVISPFRGRFLVSKGRRWVPGRHLLWLWTGHSGLLCVYWRCDYCRNAPIQTWASIHTLVDSEFGLYRLFLHFCKLLYLKRIVQNDYFHICSKSFNSIHNCNDVYNYKKSNIE